jgi:hypothetical protein
MGKRDKGSPPKSAPSSAPARSTRSKEAFERARDRAAVFAASLPPREDLLILCGYVDPDDDPKRNIDCFGLLILESVREPVDVRHRFNDDEIRLVAVSRPEYARSLKEEFFAAFGNDIAKSMAAVLTRKIGRATVIVASKGALHNFLSVPLGSGGHDGT